MAEMPMLTLLSSYEFLFFICRVVMFNRNCFLSLSFQFYLAEIICSCGLVLMVYVKFIYLFSLDQTLVMISSIFSIWENVFHWEIVFKLYLGPRPNKWNVPTFSLVFLSNPKEKKENLGGLTIAVLLNFQSIFWRETPDFQETYDE